MLEGIGIYNAIKQIKKRKQKFANNEITDNTVDNVEKAEEEEDNKIARNVIFVINFLILIYALYLYFQCGKLRDDFNIMEGLAALCYPLIYIIYRLAISPMDENCLNPAVKGELYAKRQELLNR